MTGLLPLLVIAAVGGADAERTENAEAEIEEAPREEAVLEHGAQGGPPPPVVPNLRKGAKASLKRKGGR